ncbi:MAG: aspartyl protease family protein [Patescibacteria group bacterium]
MRKSGIVFPYGITLQEGGAITIFPAAEVSVCSETGEWLSLLFLIDSGATISALPRSDAVALGIDYQMGAPLTVTGIGQLVAGRMHMVEIRLGLDSLKIPIAFLELDTAPRILGRAGIFDRYTIILEETTRQSAFLRNRSPASKRIRTILNGLR